MTFFQIDDNKSYTVNEVAKMFRVTPYTVREWIKRGQLTAIKVGRRYLIRPQDLHEYIRNKYEDYEQIRPRGQTRIQP